MFAYNLYIFTTYFKSLCITYDAYCNIKHYVSSCYIIFLANSDKKKEPDMFSTDAIILHTFSTYAWLNLGTWSLWMHKAYCRSFCPYLASQLTKLLLKSVCSLIKCTGTSHSVCYRELCGKVPIQYPLLSFSASLSWGFQWSEAKGQQAATTHGGEAASSGD